LPFHCSSNPCISIESTYGNLIRNICVELNKTDVKFTEMGHEIPMEIVKDMDKIDPIEKNAKNECGSRGATASLGTPVRVCKAVGPGGPWAQYIRTWPEGARGVLRCV
jgi:hypothetical protein